MCLQKQLEIIHNSANIKSSILIRVETLHSIIVCFCKIVVL